MKNVKILIRTFSKNKRKNQTLCNNKTARPFGWAVNCLFRNTICGNHSSSCLS